MSVSDPKPDIATPALDASEPLARLTVTRTGHPEEHRTCHFRPDAACRGLVSPPGLDSGLRRIVLTAFVRVISAPAGINAQAYEIIVDLASERVALANLFLLLLGFAVVANQFEQSNLPEVIPSRLPDGWRGGVTLLAFVFGLSIFLDNIAGAIIGGVIARHVYRRGVTIGFMAAIVAAANAGGAGSVIGDTTTTMMWIRGVSPLQLARAS